MYIWFKISMLGMILSIPLYFLSVDHLKLKEKYGKEKGLIIAKIFGLISGYLFFLFWIAIWISPQPHYTISILQDILIQVPIINISIPILHLIIFLPFFLIGAWFGIMGVKEVGIKVAETHYTRKIITTGPYSLIRHPQYLGGLLTHIGISFLLSAWYSLLFTPLMIGIIYLISRKEEKELIREFDDIYENYQKNVPMLFPRFKP